jgi:uncharacterized membrane protein YcaP (DUF421 family)
MFEEWLADVFSCPDGLTLLAIVGRSALIYLLIILAMRLLGTRPQGRMTIYDFVLVVVLSNAVQNALVAGDNTLVGGLASALTLLLVNLAYTWLLNRFPRLGKHLVGEPVVLISDGYARWESMQSEGVTRDELMAALREHGVLHIGEVRLAVLEVDGTVSVVPAHALVHRTRRRFRSPGAS